MGKLRPVRGTRDLLDEECRKLEHIQRTAQEIGVRYGFVSVQTPVFEFQDVFCKTLGDSSDIIGKEMYTFPDRGGDIIALRPEFTAAVARLFLCANLPTPSKLFTAGHVFRYERPQKCRQRQFQQINYEHFGATSYVSDAEIISLAYSILYELGIDDKVVLEINSLGDEESIRVYREGLVKYFTARREDLSEDSKKRLITNPLRILDSKDSCDIPVLAEAPAISNYYSTEAKRYFEGVLSMITDLKIPHVVNSKLVRGLDYYCGTVFEFKTTHLGSQDAIIAGGRYDKLITMMGGDDVPAIGFAGGVERIAALADCPEKRRFCIAVLLLCEGAEMYAVRLVHELRNAGMKVVCDYEICKIKAGLRRVSKFADVVLLIGEDEFRSGTASCKNMYTGQQETVSIGSLLEYMRSVEITANS